MVTQRRRPRPGDRFVHQRFLRNDAKPPYTEESYDTFVVTATRQAGPEVVVYHTRASLYDAGRRRGSWYFSLSKEAESVRRWLRAAPCA